MNYWEFWNRVKKYSKKFKLYIYIENVSEDKMKIIVEDFYTHMKFEDSWNFCKEDEYEFLARLETICKNAREELKKFEDIGYLGRRF